MGYAELAGMEDGDGSGALRVGQRQKDNPSMCTTSQLDNGEGSTRDPRARAGGCWVGDPVSGFPNLTNLTNLSTWRLGAPGLLIRPVAATLCNRSSGHCPDLVRPCVYPMHQSQSTPADGELHC